MIESCQLESAYFKMLYIIFLHLLLSRIGIAIKAFYPLEGIKFIYTSEVAIPGTICTCTPPFNPG